MTDEKEHYSHFIGKQYKTRLTETEAAYVERIRIAQKLKSLSAALRLLVQDGRANKRFEAPTE